MNKRKKIVMLGPVFPYRGGNSVYLSYVYDTLIQRFDVKVINYKLLYPSFLFPGTTQYDTSNVTLKEIPSERILNSINPFTWYRTAHRIIKEDPDLLVIDWWHPFFGLCLNVITTLLKLSGKFKHKILFLTENFISHEGNYPDKILTRLGLANADAFLTLSDVVRKDLKYTFPQKKSYRSELPIMEYYKFNSLPTQKAKELLGYKETEKLLLFFGYVRKYKGLDILLKAMKGIINDFPGIKLLSVGEFYDNPHEYYKIIEENNIQDNVKVINKFIPNEEVYKYYSAADLVVQPYRSATQSAILSVAYGFLKPAVVTRVGGLEEFVEDERTGIIVDPDSPEEIRKGVKRFFEIKDKVDFAANIGSFIKKNKFRDLDILFEEILKDSEKGFPIS